MESLDAIVVAGTHSGVGKTTVTLGVIGALRRRGLVVQPFKVGPDFIDPLHHGQASGRTSLNLDGWMLDRETNLRRFARATADADVAVVEGVMGVYDGSEGGSDRGSTAELAKQLGLPVVLVVDAGAMARSAAALVHGFASFDPELRVTGIVLNNVGGPGHVQLLRDAIAGTVPILGALPRTPELTVPERHLGLHLPHEARAGYVDELAALVERHVDLDLLLEAGRIPRVAPAPEPPPRAAAVRVGVARDEAFCFYYADNLELLERAGAELVEFSPLSDPLPDGLDGVYVGGGYPELHAEQLSANERLRAQLREFAAAGRPVYGECGGLMYLGESLELDGTAYPLCGALPLSTRMPAALTIGYAAVETTGGLFGAGRRARGHVFHRSELAGPPPALPRFRLETAHGTSLADGYEAGGALAGYAHLHFASDPGLADAFVERCAAR